MPDPSAPKTIVVTGAGSGIGREVAQHFLANGYRTALLGRTPATLEETANGNELALIVPCDVSDPAQVDEAFASLRKSFNRLDVLFNNAGVMTPTVPIDEIALEDWYTCVNVNLHGAFLCARAAFSWMRHQEPQGGRIINNGSIAAYAPRPGSVPYTTTKHAITGLTRTLSIDGRAFNIAAGQIDIGNALTDMVRAIGEGIPQEDGTVLKEPTMDVQHVATSVYHMAELPLDANVQFMTVMATTMPYIGRG